MASPQIPLAPSTTRRILVARRLKSIESVERSYQEEGLPALSVPIRKVDLWSTANRKSPILREYFERDYGAVERYIKRDSRKTLLFHSCANEISPSLLQSFSKRGPSIRFARPKSYFSRRPAVYWTDSLDFAFAWGVFTETGRWIPNISNEPISIECLVYVSKVDLSSIPAPSGVHMIPSPCSSHDERELDDWCDANKKDGSNTSRIPPPNNGKPEWSLIGSRIPMQTIRALKNFEDVGLPALGKTELNSIRMYAACDEPTSQYIAEAGVEILHVLSNPVQSKL